MVWLVKVGYLPLHLFLNDMILSVVMNSMNSMNSMTINRIELLTYDQVIINLQVFY